MKVRSIIIKIKEVSIALLLATPRKIMNKKQHNFNNASCLHDDLLMLPATVLALVGEAKDVATDLQRCKGVSLLRALGQALKK